MKHLESIIRILTLCKVTTVCKLCVQCNVKIYLIDFDILLKEKKKKKMES